MKISNQKRLDYLFKEIAKKFPDNIAVSIRDTKITYQELDKYSDYVSNYILKNKISQSPYIGVYFKSGINVIVHILGILKAGFAYIPIDPLYPKERINYIIDDSQLSVILSEEGTELNFDQDKANVVKLNYDEITQSITNTSNLNNPDRFDEAYVIYTSGTTGKPKGVVVKHDNLTRLFSNTNTYFQFSEKEKWTLFHSLSFDFSVWEIFGALLYGGELVIVPYSVSRNSRLFLELINKKGITVLNQTPTAFSNFIQEEKSSLEKIETLKYIIFGGEKLNLNTLKPWLERYPLSKTKLINMYGITETTVHVTYKELNEDSFQNTELIPIGKPISDLQIYLFDRDGEQIDSANEIGEIYIAGKGLAKEYLNKPELTKDRFIFKKIDNKEIRLYKTGDEAYFHNDEFYYVGRNDSQIQLNGFRIELNEIITTSQLNSKLAKSVVLVKKISETQEGLVNYLQPNVRLNDQDKETLKNEVSILLRSKLPNYMIPFESIVLNEFPLTSNGKLDVKALEKINYSTTDSHKEGISQNITAIWQKVLGIESVPMTEDFFDLGGTSLSLIQLFKQVKEAYNIKIDTQTFIEGLSLSMFLKETKKQIALKKVELSVTDIWKETLNIKEIVLDEDFFDIGGTSLSLILLIKRIKEVYGIKLSTTTFINGLSLNLFIKEIKEQLILKDIDKSIIAIWKDILGLNEIHKDEDFFDLGGTSLSLIQLIIQIKDKHGIPVNTSRFTEGLTLSSLITEVIKYKKSQKLQTII